MAATGRPPLLLAQSRSALGSVAQSWVPIDEEISLRSGSDEADEDNEEYDEYEDERVQSSRESSALPSSAKAHRSESQATATSTLQNGLVEHRRTRSSANSSSILRYSAFVVTHKGPRSSRLPAERDSSIRNDEAFRTSTAELLRTDTLQAGLLLDWDERALCCPPTTDARVAFPDADAEAGADLSHEQPQEEHPQQHSQGGNATDPAERGGRPPGSIAKGDKGPLWPGGLEGHSLVGLCAGELSVLGACAGMMVSGNRVAMIS